MEEHARRRSVLCVPGCDQRKIVKAMAVEADQVVIDLEDAVSPADKDRAREQLGSIPWSDFGDRTSVAVRVNATRTQWCHRDIEAVVQSAVPASSIVLPKVECPGDLAFAERLLDGVEAGGNARPVMLEALIETADGLTYIDEIAAASSRLRALIIGYADLAASLGRSSGLAPELWISVQDRVIGAARANRLDAVDGPFLGVNIDEPFKDSVAHAARIGFDAKWAIHPRQVSAINTVFDPTPEEIDRAERIVAALKHAQADGRGAVLLDGEMIDEAVAVAARRTLAKAGGLR